VGAGDEGDHQPPAPLPLGGGSALNPIIHVNELTRSCHRTLDSGKNN
jgi:hypothetical protein